MKTVLTAEPEQAGLRLDAFLSAASGELSRSHIQKLIRSGDVTVNGKTAKPSQKIEKGDHGSGYPL